MQTMLIDKLYVFLASFFNYCDALFYYKNKDDSTDEQYQESTNSIGEREKLGGSNLIGTTEERNLLRQQQDDELHESIKQDSERERRYKIDGDRKQSLMESRKLKLKEEPSLEEDHLVIRIRHPTLGMF